MGNATFQSTLLMRGATRASSGWCAAGNDFNPRSSCEERRQRPADGRDGNDFNPRSSCEERLAFCRVQGPQGRISIHAPHARSDLMISRQKSWRLYFNPRSSCEERLTVMPSWRYLPNFNPRSSCEERQFLRICFMSSVDFNPRSSCEERRQAVLKTRAVEHISIHAPHARSDLLRLLQQEHLLGFQSTLLMRGATARQRSSMTS